MYCFFVLQMLEAEWGRSWQIPVFLLSSLFIFFISYTLSLNFRFEPPWQAAPPTLAPWFCASVAWRRRRRLPFRLPQHCFHMRMHPFARKWAYCASDATCQTSSVQMIGHDWPLSAPLATVGSGLWSGTRAICVFRDRSNLFPWCNLASCLPMLHFTTREHPDVGKSSLSWRIELMVWKILRSISWKSEKAEAKKSSPRALEKSHSSKSETSPSASQDSTS